MSEHYKCRFCGWESSERDHCPNCLCGIHEADSEDYECGGTLQPIAIWVKPDDTWELLSRCTLCGEITSAPVASDDNPMKLLSIASKPLAEPPFPIERLEELSRLTGTVGEIGQYRRKTDES